jgi:hypothetical protein
MKKCNPDKIETEGERKGQPVYLGDSPVGKDCTEWKDGNCMCKGKCCLQEVIQ